MKRFLLYLNLFTFCSLTITLYGQWVQVNGAFPFTYTWVEAIVGNGTNIYTGTHSNGMFLSADNGTTWVAINSGLPAGTITYSLALNGSNVFAGTNNNWGIYLTTNNGTTWTQTGLTGIAINCITGNGTNMFVGTNGYGVYLSTDNGTSWTTSNTGLDNKYVTSFATIGTNIFAGTLGGTNYGVFASTDNGTTWTRGTMTGFTSANITALLAVGTNLFAGTFNGGMFLSTDNGTNWTAVNTGLTNLNVRSSVVSGSNLFVGTNGGGVYLTTDNGISWSAVNTSLTNKYVYSLAVIGSDLYAGTLGSGVWRRTLSELVTSVEDNNIHLPSNFSLSQNYPNPFNPSTNIRFEVPTSGFVSLKVFDVIGREVAALVNEYKPAGSYDVNFDASKLSSGIYFYRLQTGDFISTKKMVLTK